MTLCLEEVSQIVVPVFGRVHHSAALGVK